MEIQRRAQRDCRSAERFGFWAANATSSICTYESYYAYAFSCVEYTVCLVYAQ